jgi:hypothetical protein
MLSLLLASQAACEEENVPATIQQVKADNEQRLMALSGVVSVGIGRDADGKPVIVIGLDGPRPQTVSALPQHIDGYPVQTQIIGPVKAQ